MPRGYDPKSEECSALSSYLITDGKLGEVPEWYTVIRSARYLNVAPWDVANQPAIWLKWALAAENAEHVASEELKRHAERKSKNKRKS